MRASVLECARPLALCPESYLRPKRDHSSDRSRRLSSAICGRDMSIATPEPFPRNLHLNHNRNPPRHRSPNPPAPSSCGASHPPWGVTSIHIQRSRAMASPEARALVAQPNPGAICSWYVRQIATGVPRAFSKRRRASLENANLFSQWRIELRHPDAFPVCDQQLLIRVQRALIQALRRVFGNYCQHWF